MPAPLQDDYMRVIDHPSPNHGPRPEGTPIDMLVLHYTGMRSAAEALARLTDPAAEVSAHYLIDEDGATTRLVAEERRAWHAGRSFWRGETDINSRSIGIELVNPGHEFGYRPFPAAQMTALTGLAREILARHPIPARNVVGHSDVAPTRKQDPGELFDWPGLADQGIGLWPSDDALPPAPAAAQAAPLLARFGYAADPAWRPNEPELAEAMRAFQRHFRPDRCDGTADPECLRRLAGLLAMVERPA